MNYEFQRKKTFINLDVARIVLAFFVVIIHASNPANSTAEFFLNTSIVRLAVPLFFMLSGFNFSMQKLSDFQYVKKYTKRQIKFFLPWTIAFAAIYLISFLVTGDTKFARLLSPLWFVVALVACVFYLHLLLKKLNLTKILILASVLHFIGILADAYFVVIKNVPGLSPVIAFINTIFPTTRNGIFFGLFYITLGLFLKEKEVKVKFSQTFYIILIMLFAAFQLTELIFLRNMQNTDYDLFISLIPLSILTFTFLTRNAADAAPNFKLRKFSMFVYVSHIAILVVLQDFFNLSSFALVLAIVTIVYVLIALVIFLKNKTQSTET